MSGTYTLIITVNFFNMYRALLQAFAKDFCLVKDETDEEKVNIATLVPVK